MYSVLPSFVLGFHGCDRSVGEDVLADKSRLLPSENSYDWLGSGIYFGKTIINRLWIMRILFKITIKRPIMEII